MARSGCGRRPRASRGRWWRPRRIDTSCGLRRRSASCWPSAGARSRSAATCVSGSGASGTCRSATRAYTRPSISRAQRYCGLRRSRLVAGPGCDRTRSSAVDCGLEPGTSRVESAELVAARQKIRDLEEDNKFLCEAAAAIAEVVGPKERYASWSSSRRPRVCLGTEVASAANSRDSSRSLTQAAAPAGGAGWPGSGTIPDVIEECRPTGAVSRAASRRRS